MNNHEFRCFHVSRREDGQLRHAIQTIHVDDLPRGEVVIRVRWSSLNYKDALAATGAGKILRKYPLVGGIDLGPYSGYGELQPFTKLFMALQMVLGRLEIVAPIVLLTPAFWKKS